MKNNFKNYILATFLALFATGSDTALAMQLQEHKLNPLPNEIVTEILCFLLGHEESKWNMRLSFLLVSKRFNVITTTIFSWFAPLTPQKVTTMEQPLCCLLLKAMHCKNCNDFENLECSQHTTLVNLHKIEELSKTIKIDPHTPETKLQKALRQIGKSFKEKKEFLKKHNLQLETFLNIRKDYRRKAILEKTDSAEVINFTLKNSPYLERFPHDKNKSLEKIYRVYNSGDSSTLEKNLRFLLPFMREPNKLYAILIKTILNNDLSIVKFAASEYKKSISFCGINLSDQQRWDWSPSEPGEEDCSYYSTSMKGWLNKNMRIIKATAASKNLAKINFYLENFEKSSKTIYEMLSYFYSQLFDKVSSHIITSLIKRYKNHMATTEIGNLFFKSVIHTQDERHLHSFIKNLKKQLPFSAVEKAFIDVTTHITIKPHIVKILIEEYKNQIGIDLAFRVFCGAAKNCYNSYKSNKDLSIEVIKLLLEHFTFSQEQLRQALETANHEDIKAVIRGEIRGGGGEQGNEQTGEEFIL